MTTLRRLLVLLLGLALTAGLLGAAPGSALATPSSSPARTATAGAAARIMRLPAAADTYTNIAHARTTYGRAWDLRVGGGRWGVKTSYLRFTVPAWATWRVRSATLLLTRTAHRLPLTWLTARSYDRGWYESMMTAQRAPRLGPIVSTRTVNPKTFRVGFDVTRAIVRGRGVVSIAVTSRVWNNVAMFRSRAAGAYGPKLVLTVAALRRPASPAGPIGSLPRPVPPVVPRPSEPTLPTAPAPSPSAPAPVSSDPVPSPPVATPPVTTPPAPPVTTPPAPPVTTPPAPPVTTPPAPPVTTPPAPPVTTPPAPPVTTPPAPPVTTPPAPPVTTPPVTTPPAPPVTTPPAPPVTTPPAALSCTLSPLLVSSCGVLLGITPQAYSATLPIVSQALAKEETLSDRKFDIVHVYKRNGSKFPNADDIAMANQGRLLSITWKPATDMTWAAVAAGRADSRIDAEAAYLKATFNRPFYLSIYHEPEDNVNPATGSGMTTADYVAMYRHTIQRLRAQGATMFTTVVNYMGWFKWDAMRDALYPGDDVVDWIAWDPYMPVAGNTPGHDFAGLVNTAHGTSPGFYTWATTRHPGKPLMIAEWGLFDEGLKTNPLGAAQFYATIADELSRFPAIKALDHFTMELSDTPGQGQATAPWLTAAGWLAWKRLMQDPVFAPHA